MNLSGGGKLIENRVWINGTIRRWIVNKYVSNLNPDGTQALDDNTLKNYSGKIVAQVTTNNKVPPATSGTTRSAAIVVTAPTVSPTSPRSTRSTRCRRRS